VLIPAPFWVTYAEQARLAGATPVQIDTSPPGWKLSPEVLREHITPRSKALMLCTPSNPTGCVYTDAELAGLASVVAEAGLVAIVDEIYARISYVPVGSWLRAAPDLADHSLIIDGVSKAYAMTGWRLGWLIGPQPIVQAAAAIQSHLTSHPSSITQRAALFALQQNPQVEATVDEMVRVFRQRRDAIVEELSRVPGFDCPTPEGAFYVFPDARGLLNRPLGPNGRVVTSTIELSAYLLDEALVNTVPGEAFGTPGFVRFSYALGMDDLREGIHRIAAAVQ
jgi:aspartate aminotransferase